MTSVIVRSCTAGLVLRSWIFSVNVTPSDPGAVPVHKKSSAVPKGQRPASSRSVLASPEGGRRQRRPADHRRCPHPPPPLPSRTSPRFEPPVAIPTDLPGRAPGPSQGVCSPTVAASRLAGAPARPEGTAIATVPRGRAAARAALRSD